MISLVACQTIERPVVELNKIKMMEREQNDFDQLPPELGTNIDLDSVRLLDSRNSRKYWGATNEDGDLCLIVGFNIGRPDWSAGLNCDEERLFDSQGLGVATKGPNHFSGAIFVPDGYTLKLVDAFPGQYIAENLVAFDSLAGLQSAVGDQDGVIVQSVDGDKPDIELQIVR
ncbi:MAG: hypothetical protein AB8G95_28645 [Anaerolineae bacterium]